MASQDRVLREILKEVCDGTIQLPDFQRDWVWDDNRIKALIVSLANNYPVGAVMFLETGGEINFKYRKFTGITDEINRVPSNLVLDGQQRITSILNAMYLTKPVNTQTEQNKKIKRFYYFDINEIAKEHIDWDFAVISVNENKQITSNFGKTIELDLSTTELECKQKYIPVNIIFDEIAFSDWRREFQNYYKINDLDNLMHHIDMLQLFEQKVRNNIFNYHIPVITLSKDTPKEAVCQVFENVNTGGVALNVFELVTAIFASDGFNLREDWTNRVNHFKEHKAQILSSVSATDFLTAMTLYTKYLAYKENPENAVLCKRKNVLELKMTDFKAYADNLEHAFLEAAKFLNSLCIYSDRDIPYSTQLIPLSAVIAALGDKFHYSDVKDKVAQWYWCGIFGEMYGGANETRYALDIVGLMNWICNSGEAPDTIKRSYFDPCRLLSLQTRNSAAYKGIMALIMKNGARDFISSEEMNLTYFIDENIDIHHIFPKDYCMKENLGQEDSKWNSIINKTPLSAKSNRMIGGKAPSEYLKNIEKNMTDTSKLSFNLQSHLVSVEDIYSNNFDTYFIKRTKSILTLISNAMGKNISGLDSEDVINRYGCSLVD